MGPWWLTWHLCLYICEKCEMSRLWHMDGHTDRWKVVQYSVWTESAKNSFWILQFLFLPTSAPSLPPSPANAEAWWPPQSTHLSFSDHTPALNRTIMKKCEGIHFCTNWELHGQHFSTRWNNMEATRSQLWWQFWDTFDTTLTQLWHNFDKILKQLWQNFDGT